MKKITLLISCMFIIGTIAACGTGGQPPEEVEPTPPTEDNETPGTVDETPEAGDEQPVDQEEDEFPEERELAVTIEGETENRLAYLQVSDLNYHLYVLEDYTFTAEEPGKDVVYFNNDDHFFVRIEPLGDNVDSEELENNILDHAQGTVQEEHPVPLNDTEYSILEIVETDTENTVLIHTAKRIDDHLFKFTLFIPGTEAAEGTEPSFWAMLKTIQVNN